MRGIRSQKVWISENSTLNRKVVKKRIHPPDVQDINKYQKLIDKNCNDSGSCS